MRKSLSCLSFSRRKNRRPVGRHDGPQRASFRLPESILRRTRYCAALEKEEMFNKTPQCHHDKSKLKLVLFLVG